MFLRVSSLINFGVSGKKKCAPVNKWGNAAHIGSLCGMFSLLLAALIASAIFIGAPVCCDPNILGVFSQNDTERLHVTATNG